MTEDTEQEKLKKAFPKLAKILEETPKKPELGRELRDKLTSGHFQKGLVWRKEKLESVAQARRIGITDEEIFKQLKIAGLMDITARNIMKDAYYLDGITSDGLTDAEVKEEMEEDKEKRKELEEYKRTRPERKKPLEP